MGERLFQILKGTTTLNPTSALREQAETTTPPASLANIPADAPMPEIQRLSHAQQTLFLLALAVAGLIAGQVVRQARRLSQGLAVTVIHPEEP